MASRPYALLVLLGIGCSNGPDPASSVSAAESQPSDVVWCTPGSTCAAPSTGALPRTASLEGTTTDGACTVTVDVVPLEVQGTACNPGVSTMQDIANRDSEDRWSISAEATVTCGDGVRHVSVFHPGQCGIYDGVSFAAFQYHSGRLWVQAGGSVDAAGNSVRPDDYLDLSGTSAGLHTAIGDIQVDGVGFRIRDLAFVAAP